MNEDDDLDRLFKSALTAVTKDLRKEKKSLRRGERLSTSARNRLYSRNYHEMSIKDASFRVMERAYMRASNNNMLPANARQIMYQARPLIQELTTKMWKNDSLFTQDYLPRFIREHSALTASWDVVYDARGHIQEPHTERRIDLGTVEVREYIQQWHREAPPLTIDPISLGVDTHGPANRFGAVLFIEKEGFSALLDRVEVAKRYDIAIMSTKGMSVTASRQLVESLTAKGVPTLVAHDFDVSGLTICHTLQANTTRYKFERPPNVKCLGLRLIDARNMGLASENVTLKKDSRHELRRSGATSEEMEFLLNGERVELNAMDSQQFVDWLEQKFREHGVTKVVPDVATLEAAYKRAVLVGQANKALARVQKKWSKNGNSSIKVPGDLPERIRARIDGTNRSWDEAIKEIEASVS